MTTALLISLGAALGAPARLATGHVLRERFAATAAAGTLAVNVVGSFILGLLVGAGVQGSWLSLIGVGFCGALTTMSTLALEIWEALSQNRIRHALANISLSLLLGILAAFTGWWITH